MNTARTAEAGDPGAPAGTAARGPGEALSPDSLSPDSLSPESPPPVNLPPDGPNGIDDPFDPANAPMDMPADPTTIGPPEEGLSESLTEELAALIDDARTYASAEIAFQKTRASLAGKNAGMALGFAVVAIVVLHVAVLAFAVGMVMALAPLVTIWGAILIVVGALLIGAGLLGWQAARHGKRIAAIFAKDDPPPAASEGGN